MPKITVWFLIQNDWKQTARGLSDHLRKGTEITFKFSPDEVGAATVIVGFIKCPWGYRIEEHWSDEVHREGDREYRTCTLKLVRL